MRSALVVVVLSVLLTPAVSSGETWIPFSSDESAREMELAVAAATANDLVVDVAVPGVSLGTTETEQGAYTRLEIPGAGRIGAVGAPMLPALRRFVEVPEGAIATVEVTVHERRTVNLVEHGLGTTLYPVQRPRPKCDCPEADKWTFSHDRAAYRGVVAHEPASLDGPFGFRDHRMMLLTLSPVRYDAANGTLDVVTRATVTVRFSGGDMAATVARKQRLSSRHYDAFVAARTLNLNLADVGKDAGWAYPDDAPVELVIVTPPQLVTDLAPFVEWKTSCGYNVTVATTDVTGTTTSAIKTYLTGLYNGPNPPVYVLMIGDSPTPLATYTTSNAGGGTDLPFVQMDGDLYPDMMIARWPIDDPTELVNMRDKILHYEQPTAANSAWLNRALFLGGDDYPSHGMTTHQDIIAELMEPAPNSAECEYWDGEASNPSTQDLIDALDSGKAWAVYSAHSGPSGWSGDPPFDSSDVPDLNNAGMYPLGIGHSCSSNEWANHDDVFGEVTVIQADKGFVSYWGGSNSTYWDEDDWLERGYFDSMFDTHLTGNLITLTRQYSNAAVCYSGLTEVTLWNGNEQYYWEIYNLNGDPTLDPFTRLPLAVNVDAPAVVPPVADDVTVTVSDSFGAVPVAMVGVTQNGVLLGAGMTDGTGVATFPIEAPSPGTALQVRVTAHNHLPTDASTLVAAGNDGVVVLDAGAYRCDSVVTVDVFDDGLDGAGPIMVDLDATPSGGHAAVQLVQISSAPVRYQGAATLGSELNVAHGDVLTVTYHDADTGGGNPGDKTDTATVDCAGPAISGVATSATHEDINVTFTTDEPGTTVVLYGVSSPPSIPVTDPAMVTDHELLVGGLAPCTRYFLEVHSTDALGNETVDDNGGQYYVVDTAGWTTLLEQLFSSDPGWTVDNGGNAHGWAFGQPMGQGGSYGQPDPTSGHTGLYVYGVNLAGDYDDGLGDNQLQLTTPSIDCSEATSLSLRYWRWLGVENSSWDHARVQVSVSGGAWQTVWENGSSSEQGGSWVEMVHDLTAIAAGQADVRLRWTLGSTDSSVVYCGWNLDDVVLEGAMPCDPQDPPLFADGFETGDCNMWASETGAP